MATEFPQTNISGVGLATFAHEIQKSTQGAIAVETLFAGEARVSSSELVEAVAHGRFTGGDAFAGPLEIFNPIFGFSSLPFIAGSVDCAQAINAKARPLYEKALGAIGLKLLYITVWPATGLWSDRELTAIEDIRGLRVRTNDQNAALVFRNAGAQAFYLPFNAAMEIMETGELNAILSSGDGGAGEKIARKLRYFKQLDYAAPVSLAFVGKPAFCALPEHLQVQTAEAARITEEKQAGLLANRAEENYKAMRRNGVRISALKPAIVEALKHNARPISDAWKSKLDSETARLIEQITEP